MKRPRGQDDVNTAGAGQTGDVRGRREGKVEHEPMNTDDIDPKSSIFDDLTARGYSALKEVVETKREETLHLEFKTLSNHLTASLTKDDRKLIAKSVCGFSNAEGGILVLGVETTRSDGVDIAKSLRHFANVEALKNRVVSAASEFLSPQNPHLTIAAIADPSDISTGFIFINVPSSDARPHMSIPHHQYFRRGSDGTRVLEHGEVRELMFLPREGKLSVRTRMRNTMSSDKGFEFDCILSLRNEGRVPVRAPFIIALDRNLRSASEGDPDFKRRQHPNGGVGIYATGDVVVHVEDELDVASVKMFLRLHGAEGYNPEYFLEITSKNKSQGSFSIRTKNEGWGSATLLDTLIDMKVSFGGEGAPTRIEQIAIEKWATFEMMAEVILGEVERGKIANDEKAFHR